MFAVPLILRGKVLEEATQEFGGRRGAVRFSAPDIHRHLGELPLASPSLLEDLYGVSFAEILSYLEELGGRLTLERNPHLQAAYELSSLTSGLSPEVLRHVYRALPRLFNREFAQALAERTVGVRYLEGWVPGELPGGARVSIRAFGARAVHIVAGNNPAVSALTVLRNALTRGDAIIKSPSNDPLTAAAIGRTMIEMAPDHPLSRHLSVAYWKGGDEAVEAALFQPRHIEKIVAWGGLASITHAARYIQPGIDLITLDPKLSSTIIGREAFADELSIREAADRLAHDVGAGNQEGCVNARVVYVQTGTGPEGIALATRLGRLVYEAIRALPAHLSGPARAVNRELAEEIHALKLANSDYEVIGCGREGGVIVSQLSEPVDFSPLLANRIANLVPIDDIETAIKAVTSYTQTIGIYPEHLKSALRDRLALHGAQRLVSLGYASNSGVMALAGPQDAIEPLRRLCRWIVDESCNWRAAP